MDSFLNLDDFKQTYDEWKKTFTESELYKTKIENIYDVYDYEFEPQMPRNIFTKKNITLLPFFFIDKFITKDKDPEQVIDIGCGVNFYKQFYPNVYGVDPHDYGPNTRDSNLDSDWYQRHYNKCKKIISTNALHFIDVKYLKHRIDQFKKLLTPDGVGYMSLNYARIEGDKNVDKINEILGQNNFVFVLNFSQHKSECALDGNIHLIVEGENE